MSTRTNVTLGAFLLLLSAAPSFAQGVYETPPAPNSSQSMPQPPNSAPPGARTLAAGSTGQERIGTVGTTRTQPGASARGRSGASSTPKASAPR